MNKKVLTIFAVFLGIICILLSFIYFGEPARSLPVFFPGHDAALVKHHYKHGIGLVLLALGAFAYAWFQSGKKETK